MAVEISDGGTTPHATDYSDLLAKLKTFITANGWVSVASTSTEEYLRGTGAGSDNIYIGIQKYSNVAADNYAWILQGYTGYVSGTGFHNQPNAIPTNPPALPLWNTTIPYWFVCSGRRFIVVAKISTLYVVAYMGWILPYAVPAQWPYPHVIGGSTYAESSNGLIPLRYSTANGKMTAFPIPINSDSSAGTLAMRDPAATWQRPLNANGTETLVYSYWDGSGVWPWNNRLIDNFGGWDHQEKTIDGAYQLTPAVIHLESPRNVYGELDGVFHVSGRGQSAENIVQIDGVDHLVLQNVYRTSVDQYFAIKLE